MKDEAAQAQRRVYDIAICRTFSITKTKSCGMHLLVIGSTSPSGLEFIADALKAGLEMTLLVRSPSKLPEAVIENPDVHIIEGKFDNIEAITSCVTSGADTIVSFAGPVPANKGTGTPIRDFYEHLFAIAKNNPRSAINRALILSTPSYLTEGEKRTWKFDFLVSILEKMMAFAVADIRAYSALTVKQPLDKIQWTLFRVPLLKHGEAKAVHASNLGDGTESLLLTRQSMARWLLQELKDRKWVGKAPLISNPGWV